MNQTQSRFYYGFVICALTVFYLGALICGLGCGPDTIVCPPLMTAGPEAGGVALAASVEGLIILVYALLIFVLLRNSPEKRGCSLTAPGHHRSKSVVPADTNASDASDTAGKSQSSSALIGNTFRCSMDP